jgi:hypothetical protein
MFALLYPESVRVILATVPSAIVLALVPAATQIYPLVVLVQIRVLPAAARAVPATTLRLETAAVE